MKKTLYILLITFGLLSCNQNNKFSVSGVINNAEGKMLYFEQTGLLKTSILDSTRLNKSGNFKFKSARPAYPEFYNLRIDDKNLVFAVDSCENIKIDASYDSFASEYTLTGSETSLKIQKLRLSVINIQRKANNLTPELSYEERNNLISNLQKDIEVHKEMARKLILESARSAAAYYAIYQKINNTYIFSPYDKSDKPYCAAVATSFNTFMPDYERSKNLNNLVLDAINTERKEKNKEIWKEVLANKGIGYFDIVLEDRSNIKRKLSDLEGKVVLIDFSAYESELSVNYTFMLRELYNKYHSRGFEIYQVSLDRDKLLWEKSTANIPWICVRDEAGPNTTFAASYNVTSLPTNFLMNKQGTIIARSPNYNELKIEIEKQLK